MNLSANGKPIGKGRGFFVKTLLVMKWIAVFLFIACLQVSAKTNAQNVTFSAKNISLEKFLKEIKKQTGYDLWYENKLIQRAGKIDVDLKNASLQDALKTSLQDLPLSWSIIGNIIVIKQKEQVANASPPVAPPPVDTSTLLGKNLFRKYAVFI